MEYRELIIRKNNVLTAMSKNEQLDIPIKDLFLFYQRTIEKYMLFIYEFDDIIGPYSGRHLEITHYNHIDMIVNKNNNIIDQLSNMLNNIVNMINHICNLYNNTITQTRALRSECEVYKNQYPDCFTLVFEPIFERIQNELRNLSNNIGIDYVTENIKQYLKLSFKNNVKDLKIKIIKQNIALKYIRNNIPILLNFVNCDYWNCANDIKHSMDIEMISHYNTNYIGFVGFNPQIIRTETTNKVEYLYDNITYYKSDNVGVKFNLSIMCNELFNFMNMCAKFKAYVLSFINTTKILYFCPQNLNEQTEIIHNDIVLLGDIELLGQLYKFTSNSNQLYLSIDMQQLQFINNNQVCRFLCGYREWSTDKEIKKFQRIYYKYLDTGNLDYDVGEYNYPSWLQY